jgi:hypothetical protein
MLERKISPSIRNSKGMGLSIGIKRSEKGRGGEPDE